MIDLDGFTLLRDCKHIRTLFWPGEYKPLRSLSFGPQICSDARASEEFWSCSAGDKHFRKKRKVFREFALMGTGTGFQKATQDRTILAGCRASDQHAGQNWCDTPNSWRNKPLSSGPRMLTRRSAPTLGPLGRCFVAERAL